MTAITSEHDPASAPTFSSPSLSQEISSGKPLEQAGHASGFRFGSLIPHVLPHQLQYHVPCSSLGRWAMFPPRPGLGTLSPSPCFVPRQGASLTHAVGTQWPEMDARIRVCSLEGGEATVEDSKQKRTPTLFATLSQDGEPVSTLEPYVLRLRSSTRLALPSASSCTTFDAF